MKDKEHEYKHEVIFESAVAISVIASVGITIALLVISFAIHRDSKEFHYCDIGEPQIAGDYYTVDDFDIDRYCAIKDCSAYNEFQEAKNKTVRCVV